MVFVAFQTNLASRRRASKAYENHRTRTTFLKLRFTAGLQSSFERHLAQDDFQEKLSPLTFLKSRLRKSHSSLFQSPRSHSLNLQKCASVCSETRLQRSWSLSTQILDTQRVSMQHGKTIPEKNAESVLTLRIKKRTRTRPRTKPRTRRSSMQLILYFPFRVSRMGAAEYRAAK